MSKRMTLDEMVVRYGALSDAQQLSFLSGLAADLTIRARDTYEVGTENVAQPARLRQFNEFQHRVSSHLSALIDGRGERYPDQAVAQMIAEDATELGIEKHVINAFQRSLKAARHRVSA